MKNAVKKNETNVLYWSTILDDRKFEEFINRVIEGGEFFFERIRPSETRFEQKYDKMKVLLDKQTKSGFQHQTEWEIRVGKMSKINEIPRIYIWNNVRERRYKFLDFKLEKILTMPIYYYDEKMSPIILDILMLYLCYPNVVRGQLRRQGEREREANRKFLTASIESSKTPSTPLSGLMRIIDPKGELMHMSIPYLDMNKEYYMVKAEKNLIKIYRKSDYAYRKEKLQKQDNNKLIMENALELCYENNCGWYIPAFYRIVLNNMGVTNVHQLEIKCNMNHKKGQAIVTMRKKSK